MVARPVLWSMALHGGLCVGLVVTSAPSAKYARPAPPLVTFTVENVQPAAAEVIEWQAPVAEPERDDEVVVRDDELLPAPAPPSPALPEQRPPTPLSASIARERIRGPEPPPPAVVAAEPHAHVLTPVPGTNRPPDYPAAARRRGWQGTVVIAFECDEHGLVVAALVRASSGHAILDAAALAAVRSWRFHGGPGHSEQPIEFRLGA